MSFCPSRGSGGRTSLIPPTREITYFLLSLRVSRAAESGSHGFQGATRGGVRLLH